MTGVILRGQFKDPRFIKSAEAMERFFSKHTELFNGCKGGAFFEKEDGAFAEITFWDSETAAREMFDPDNEMMKIFKDILMDRLVDDLSIDFYKVGVCTFLEPELLKTP